MLGLGFRVWGLGFRVSGFGFRPRVENLQDMSIDAEPIGHESILAFFFV